MSYSINHLFKITDKFEFSFATNAVKTIHEPKAGGENVK